MGMVGMGGPTCLGVPGISLDLEACKQGPMTPAVVTQSITPHNQWFQSHHPRRSAARWVMVICEPLVLLRLPLLGPI